MVKVKICGITSRRDAWDAVDAGADALGFVFHRPSPRYIAPAEARRIVQTLPPFVTPVGVVVGGTPGGLRALVRRSGLGLVQVHGSRRAVAAAARALRPFPVMPAVQVRAPGDLAGLAALEAPVVLLDAWHPRLHGGTGSRLDLAVFAGARPRVRFVLAGGLTPANVAAAVRRVRPFGVDVSGGVESAPGRKDRAKVARFVLAAKCA